MPVNLKKAEFKPAGVQAGSYSRTFHPEATGAGGKVQSKKTIPVETQTPTFTERIIKPHTRGHEKNGDMYGRYDVFPRTRKFRVFHGLLFQ